MDLVTSCTTFLGPVCALTQEGTKRTGLPPAPAVLHLKPTLLSPTAAGVLAILAMIMICTARFLILHSRALSGREVPDEYQ